VDNSRLVAIFQPHRYSRVHFLLDEFKDAFADVDKVILLPIYAAGEKNEFKKCANKGEDRRDSKLI